jgi:hypothetical protein
MKTLIPSQIKDADLLLADSSGFLANSIKKFQKIKFGEHSPYYINHVGIFVRDKDNALVVYEQDSPGKFQVSDFNDEYKAIKTNIYIARLKQNYDPVRFLQLRYDCRILAGADRLTNYNYKGLFGFALAAFTGYKIKEPSKDRTVCSQVTAKLMNRHFQVFKFKRWWEIYPCEFAMNIEDFEIYKLLY